MIISIYQSSFLKIIFFIALFFSNCVLAFDKNISLTVASSGGSGGITLQSKIIKDHLEYHNIKSIFIFKPGAEGLIAANDIIQSKSDGTKLGLLSKSLIDSNKSINDSLTKLIHIADYYYFLISSPKVKITKNLNIGNSGFGSFDAAKKLDYFFNNSFNHIPYKSLSSVLPDIIENRIDLYFATVSQQILDFYSQDRIKIVGISSPNRLKNLQNIPALNETYKNFDAKESTIVVINSNTDDELKNFYKNIFKSLPHNENVKKILEDNYMVPVLN